MSNPGFKETYTFKKELLLKSSSDDQLEEVEYMLAKTVYNEHGKVVAEIQYDMDGNVLQENSYKYNEHGFLLEETLKDHDGLIAEHKSWEPDEQNRIAKEFRHYLDGSFDTIHYTYNDKGHLIKKETIDPDGDTESIEEMEYNTDGWMVYYSLKDYDGDLLSEKKIKYDNKGNPVEILEYDGSEDASTRKEADYYPSGNKKETLLYNDQDQLIEKIVLKENASGQLIQVLEESLTKKNTTNFAYDDKGNIILQEEFDRNGELVSKVKRGFNDDNLLVSSEVFIHGGGRGLSKNYTLRKEYRQF